MSFYENLRTLRENTGLSRKDMAEYLHMHPSAYAMYELGNREPSLEKLVNIAQILGTTTDKLLGYELSPYKFAERIVEHCDLLSFTDEQGRVGITDNGKYALKLYDTPEEFATEIIRIHNDFQFSNLCIEAKQSYLLAEILKSQFK